MGGVLEQWMQDGHFRWLPVVAALVALLPGLVFWGTKGSADAKRRKGMPPVPPVSAGWPLLGETYPYLTANNNNCISEFYNIRVAKYGKVFKTNIFFNMFVSLPALEGNKFLFSNENKLVYSTWPLAVLKLLGKGSMAIKCGDEHIWGRRLFTSFFGLDNIQKFVPQMDVAAKAQLAKYWDGKDQIVGALAVKKFTFAIAANLFMSLKLDNPDYLQFEVDLEYYLFEMMQVPIDLPRTLYHKAWLARESMLNAIHPYIQQRQ